MAGTENGWHRAGVTSNSCFAEEEMEAQESSITRLGRHSAEVAEPAWNATPVAPTTLTPPPLTGTSDGICVWKGLNGLYILCFLQKN